MAETRELVPFYENNAAYVIDSASSRELLIEDLCCMQEHLEEVLQRISDDTGDMEIRPLVSVAKMLAGMAQNIGLAVATYSPGPAPTPGDSVVTDAPLSGEARALPSAVELAIVQARAALAALIDAEPSASVCAQGKAALRALIDLSK